MADNPAPSLPSRRDILNKALLLLGSAKRIDDPDNTGDADTQSLSILWDIARRSALSLHPWNFALDRRKIDREAGDASDLGHAWKFALPVDWVRWLPWDRSDRLWFDAVEEGGFLLSDDAGPIVARGIRDVPEQGRWSPLFADVMAHTLAIEFCHAKTQLVGLRDRLSGERAEKLDEAYRVDGLASANRPRGNVTLSRWASARYRSTGVTR